LNGTTMTLLTDAQRLAWLRLVRSESVGPRTFRALFDRHGSAQAALEALPELARRAGRSVRITTEAEAEREMELARRHGVRFVAFGEAEYPKALRAIDSAPPLLGVRGRAAALAEPMVAIVGSRNASAAGLKFTGTLARDLGHAGFVIVSGLARGIDTQAHAASLPTGTVAVLAGGHDRVYPPENARLLAELLERGAAVSEMPMGLEPRGRDFPRRNRLVSGLSLGVVVVEAAGRSGSLITARFALEQGREVFAVPGSPLDPRAEGTNALIRQGATLCADASHVVSVLAPLVATEPQPGRMEEGERPDAGAEAPLWDELDLDGVAQAPSAASPPEDADAAQPVEPAMAALAQVVRFLGPSPVAVDDLVRASGLAVRQVQSVLLDLELSGRLERHGGNAVSLLPERMPPP
jgi:DNA processing protein